MNGSRAAIVGSIPCGEATSEEECVEEYVKLPESLFGSGAFYILRARGDSMKDAGSLYELQVPAVFRLRILPPVRQRMRNR